MSDAPAAPSAPSAPAAASATAPTPAPVHHAALQPREQGKFAGPPDPSNAPTATAAPAAPPSWKVDGREFKDPSELAAYAAEQRAEARALAEYREQAATAAKRATELEALTKDPRRAITPEMEDEILQRRIQAFKEQEYVNSLPEDQKRLYLWAKQQEKEKAELHAKVAERERLDAEAKSKADAEAQQKADHEAREEMKAVITESLKTAGLEPTWQNIQRAASVMHGAALRKVVYPPEVIARKVRADFDAEHSQVVGGLAPDRLLGLPGIIDKLNGLEDAALLRRLAPLGEKLRRLNLQALGAAPAGAPTPVATGAGPASVGIDTTKLSPGDPKWNEVLERRLSGK